MLMGHTDGLSEARSSTDQLLADSGSDLEDGIAIDDTEEILYSASFEELAGNNVKYDTVIWVSISLLLVLAWGVGIIMLLYLPIRRYVIRRDIFSRKLYVTSGEIVYKVSRPSFVPFWGVVKLERHVPLSRVIGIIIEQGCLQSIYGVHTFRIESISRGKPAPVDELQIQGVTNPGILRKVIISEAAKYVQDVGKSWKYTGGGENISRMTSLTDGPQVIRSPSKSVKVMSSPRVSAERRSVVPGELLLNKLEEVSRSVKKIEMLVEKSQACAEIS